MKITVIGLGATGARAARQIASPASGANKNPWDKNPWDVVSVWDIDRTRITATAESLGSVAVAADSLDDAFNQTDAVVLSFPGSHESLARKALEAGSHVISLTGDLVAVEELLGLDHLAKQAGKSVVVGAGFSPGLSGLLARHAGETFDEVDELHFAVVGAGGPACRRERAIATRRPSQDWLEGKWAESNGGGSVQRWFPDPIGSRECEALAGAEVLLAVKANPGLKRSTLKVARHERTISNFVEGIRSSKVASMTRLNVPEDSLGGLVVEIKGSRAQERDVMLVGVVDRPALAAGTVAAVTAFWAQTGGLKGPGAGSLACMVDKPVAFLRELASRGVRAAVFEA